MTELRKMRGSEAAAQHRLPAIILFCVFLVGPAYGAEQAETERMLRRITPPLVIVEEKPEAKDEWYIDSFYESSDILQGSRTGHWNELTNLFGYRHQNLRGYFSVSELERFDDKDYTANFGTYLTFKDFYVHEEIAFGWKTDYIYKLQNIVEYGHRLYRSIFWQVGYNYRGYPTNDTHMVYPGIIYYFGDHYISANYGIQFIEDRDTGHLGTIKGSFAITKFMQVTGGIAFGERLYDIFELDARDEFGYILFTGINVNIYKGINFRVGYSYGTEDPKFIKRSLDFGLSARF